MTHLRKTLGTVTAIVATATLAMPVSAAWAHSDDAGRAGYGRADLQRGLDDIVREDGVVGAQATLVDGKHRTSVRSGTAELGTDRPVPHQGYFRMGSNTKTFVSTVVLQLVAEGRIHLDDKVDRWLPGVVEGNGHDGNRITVRQLLQHTSGLPDYAPKLPMIDEEGFQKNRFHQYAPRDLVDIALRDKPLFEPGKGWSYSNTGYVLAGMIIEKATGRHWSDEVRARIIEPLGLKHTFSPGTRTGLPQPHAKAYQQFKPGGRLVDTTEVSMTWGDAAGDLITTSNDLNRFWRSLLGGKLLGPQQMAQMLKTVPAPSETAKYSREMGLGIMRTQLSCGGGYWGHGGTTLGHLNANGFVDKGKKFGKDLKGIIVMRSTNTAAEDREDRTDQLVDDALCKMD
ncbi:serine hydrolase domain-containing protein [Streptomyces alboniger]|uniref:Class A beta-lactamase-related serine hydrolase n=1 Tax=Streptomyces alboniger TaxID=132473 RepID=A0A5J6HQY3_STRAD|nr:serine hydrolase domain-containing protein [Streptomyces alboniger]QEV20853.1 class A beta-lactamase-related serine hydrolase [Streptomyces alboniger]